VAPSRVIDERAAHVECLRVSTAWAAPAAGPAPHRGRGLEAQQREGAFSPRLDHEVEGRGPARGARLGQAGDRRKTIGYRVGFRGRGLEGTASPTKLEARAQDHAGRVLALEEKLYLFVRQEHGGVASQELLAEDPAAARRLPSLE
jgi:hypothetical protein